MEGRIQLAAVNWSDGAPASAIYDEGYFSAEDALGEARAVFLAACGLPERWRDRRRFVVGELGFGLGRNLLALLDLWVRSRPPNAYLHVFSIEAHPTQASEAARAFAAWPKLADLAAQLLGAWPPDARAFHRLDFPEFHATVDVAHMEAADALSSWLGSADAWFLDGFSPARNPAMWRPELFRLLAERSTPGARAASYTAAGQVRRDLQAAGFTVERRTGFGRKRHRLEARLPGESQAGAPAPTVAIIGGGIAAASLARAFRFLGVHPQVFAGPALAASASPAALVAPRLDAGLAAPAALFAQAFSRAVRLYAAEPKAVMARGAEQIGVGEKDANRFRKIAASDLFASGSVFVQPGEPPVILLREAMTIEPRPILARWLGEPASATIAEIVFSDGRWRLLDDAGAERGRADVICIAGGIESARLAALPLMPVRGQASLARGVCWPKARLFPGGYALPTRDGVLFGATHDRGDADASPRAADHARNLDLATALPELSRAVAGRRLAAHAGVRATTRDYLPLAGAAPDGRAGLFVLAGLGSRGFTLAPLLAEHVAALALGSPSPLPAPLGALVDPSRSTLSAVRAGGAGQARAAAMIGPPGPD